MKKGKKKKGGMKKGGGGYGYGYDDDLLDFDVNDEKRQNDKKFEQKEKTSEYTETHFRG